MRRPPPEKFDEWMDLGHEIIKRARDDHELRYVEVWAELLSVEARAERLSRIIVTPAPGPTHPDEHGPAMAAGECAHASGWRKGQVVRRGFSPRFFYEHWHDLPFAIRPQQGRVRRFARTGLLRWLAGRSDA